MASLGDGGESAAFTTPGGNKSKCLENPSAPEPKVESLQSFDCSDIQVALIHCGQSVNLGVSSDALCLASPVWKEFVYPPFGTNAGWKKERKAERKDNAAEGKSQADDKKGDQEPNRLVKDDEAEPNRQQNRTDPGGESNMAQRDPIDFTEDDGEALLILLRIAHLEFDKVPTTELPFKTLLGMAALCEKYQCVRVVLPWLGGWLAKEDTESKKPLQEQWLYIAWTFGREKVFAELAAPLILEARTSEQARFLNASGEDIWHWDMMPPGILGEFPSAEAHST